MIEQEHNTALSEMEELGFEETLVQLSLDLVRHCEQRALALGLKTSAFISMCLWSAVNEHSSDKE